MVNSVNSAAAVFLAGVSQIQARISRAEQEITSGKRISTASDAPDQINTLLQLRANQQQNTQIKTNLGLAQTDAQSADNVMSSAIQLLDTAVQLGAQGATGTQTAATRNSIGQQVESLLQQMVSLSQTQVQGRFIFSGDTALAPSYQLDLSAPTGVDQLSTTAATIQVQDPAGGSFPASKTAQEIFDNRNADGTTAPDNIFAALNSLRTALYANDSAAIATGLNSVKLAETHANTMQSFYGVTQNRIQAGLAFTSSYDTQLQSQLSNIEDADVTSDALILNQASTQLQAAFQAQAKMPTQSLFNFLG